MGCSSISLAEEWRVYFALLLECSHKDHFFLYLHCPKTHPFTTFIQDLSSPVTNIQCLSSPSQAHCSLFLPKLQLKDEYSLCLTLTIVLLHLLTKLQMTLMLSPKIACYQVRLSLNICERSLSVHKTSTCQKATQKH